MSIHKLELDDAFDAVCYTLIGIHCTLEDYRLAYLLNKHLGIVLERKTEDLDFSDGFASFSIYEWEDYQQLLTWNLVSNIYKSQIVEEADNITLFNTLQTKTAYLLPEYKTVNYFLKMSRDHEVIEDQNILNKILSIPQVATAYQINPDTLQSKQNLIFS